MSTNELDAMRSVFMSAKTLRETPVVDDDFPELMHELDTALRKAGKLLGADDQRGINALAAKQYDWVERMGWHNKTVLEALALIASEVGEAVNECRGEEPSEMLGEELADIILRVLDLAQWQGIDLEQEIAKKMAINEVRGTRGRRI